MADSTEEQEVRSGTGLGSLLGGALEWRCIGPFRGGRVVAVAGHPVDSNVFYFGATAGGVWKTTDGGTYWENISDGFFKTAAVGAIAVAESDPNVIYVGTGESCIRNDVSHGDGVYKSTDGGLTWKNVGLEATRHIARIRVHPEDPDLVYVAALGHAFGTNPERGVYRSRDGGESWELVLFKSDKAGAIDLSMDANNPRTLYASIWEARRYFWYLNSGGPDCGIYKSTDGGDTWEELTDNPGMLEGVKGRIGIAASPARPGRVWALIEAEEGGLFRSDDGGATWELVTSDDELRVRSWYYTHVFADPQDPETVWALAAKVLKSTDGGRTFAEVGIPHGDQHDLWIDPRNHQRMIEGSDGGACVSFSGGETWSTLYNQPTSSIYHLDTDNQFPYRVYGSQQDNSSISVPSRSYKGAVLWSDCYLVGLSESGHIAVKPDNPDIVYSEYPGGVIHRYDHQTGQVRTVTVWPEGTNNTPWKDLKYRFQWNFPMVFSPHDPDVLYATANVAFRSSDDGTSWEQISPDLTRDDKSKQEISGGPITIEDAWAEIYCTIYAFGESPVQRGLLWAGSDDGLIHLSRNNGESWDNVTPPDLPEWTMVSIIEPSPHEAGAAYVAATRYKLDDYRPLLYKTHDYGKTWYKITNGIPDEDFTRVICEDPARRGLLYAGTETRVYVSVDDGDSWEPLQLNMPVVPIHDLAVKEGDLVAATHGRSFWILDNLAVVHQLADGATRDPTHLLKPRPAYRLIKQASSRDPSSPGKNYVARLLGTPAASYEKRSTDGEKVRVFLDAGTNPPDGVTVAYYLAKEPKDGLTLTFLDAQGEAIKAFSSKEDEEQPVKAQAGLNRFVWDTRYPDANKLLDDEDGWSPPELKLDGPLAPPGTYRVDLAVGGETYTQSFELLKDPRVATSQEDLEAQHALLVKIRDKVSETHDGANRLRGTRRQVEEWVRRSEAHALAEGVAEAAEKLKGNLSSIEVELVPVKLPKGSLRGDPLRLNGKLAWLVGVVASADWAPTKQSYEVFDELSARIDTQLQELQQVIDTDLADFVKLVGDLEIPAIAT